MAEDKKAWTELQKFETLLYMFDTLNPSPEWKKLDELPYGRNLNTVKKMIQRERERIKKEKGSDAPAKKDDTTSEAESKKPKAGARKLTPALKYESGGEGETKAKPKAPKTPRATKAKKADADDDGEDEKEKTTKKRKAPAKKGNADSGAEGPPAKLAKVAESNV